MDKEVKGEIQELIPSENEVEEKSGEGYLTDEEIADLQPVAEELDQEYKEEKEETMEVVTATREMIFARSEQPFELYIPINDKLWLFKVRRMKETDRIKFQRLTALQMKTIDQLTPEELSDIVEQGYELMASLIVEPKMSVDEWIETADLPLLSHISNKTALLAYEMDDHKIAAEFRKN